MVNVMLSLQVVGLPPPRKEEKMVATTSTPPLPAEMWSQFLSFGWGGGVLPGHVRPLNDSHYSSQKWEMSMDYSHWSGILAGHLGGPHG